MTKKKMAAFVIPAFALILCTSGGAPAANLAINGGFEVTTNGPGQFDLLTQATGWTSENFDGNAYNLLFAAGTADNGGTPNQDNEMLELWGPNNGSANGLPAASPAGGNFIASNPVFQETGPIQQTINGLSIGDTYEVGFWWAGAQQYEYDGDTVEGWVVSLGASTQATPIVNNVSHGFTGWMYETFNFTANNTSELLSFLAVGGPTLGLPPFVLLDGVSVTAVPEPGTLLLMVGGIVALGAVRLRRRSKSDAA